MLAVCGRTVSLWDSITHTIVDTFPKESLEDWEYTDISWSCDQKNLAVLKLLGPVEILTIGDGKIQSSQKLTGASFPVDRDSHPTSIAFMRNSSRYLAVGSKNGSVAIWDCKANSFRKTFLTDGIKGAVEFLDFNTFGSHIAAGMSSGNVLVHEYSGTMKKRYRVPQSTRVTSMRYQAARTSVVGAGSAEGHVAFWNTITGTEVSVVLGAHQKSVTDIAFSPADTKLVATVSHDKRLCFHDIVHQNQVVKCNTAESLTSIDLSNNGVLAVVGTQSGRLLTFDIRSLSYPMATFDVQSTPVKKLRFAKSTIDNPVLGSVTGSPSASAVSITSTPLNLRGYGNTSLPISPPETPATPAKESLYSLFSPLRSASFLDTSSSMCSESSSSAITPNQSFQDFKKNISGVKTEHIKTSQSFNELSATNAGIPLGDPNGNRSAATDQPDALLNIQDTLKSQTTKSPGAGMDHISNEMQSNAAGVCRIVLPENSDTENGRCTPSISNTSTPLHDGTMPTLFPFADPTTHVEISPINEVEAMTHSLSILPVPISTSSISLLNCNIGDDPVGESRLSEDNKSDWNVKWNSDMSDTSSDMEFHSQREEENGEEGAVPQKLAGLTDVTQPLVNVQRLEQLMTENFDRLFGALAQINERLTAVESKLPS